jgi:DNA uptake protein ComE-like DNA-binding protein
MLSGAETPPGLEMPQLSSVPPEGSINLNTVTFEQLRAHSLSVTQATRILAYRERMGGFSSVDDLDEVPGFPRDFLVDFKTRVTV